MQLPIRSVKTLLLFGGLLDLNACANRAPVIADLWGVGAFPEH
jgi:hypothetical protein